MFRVLPFVGAHPSCTVGKWCDVWHFVNIQLQLPLFSYDPFVPVRTTPHVMCVRYKLVYTPRTSHRLSPSNHSFVLAKSREPRKTLQLMKYSSLDFARYSPSSIKDYTFNKRLQPVAYASRVLDLGRIWMNLNSTEKCFSPLCGHLFHRHCSSDAVFGFFDVFDVSLLNAISHHT